MCDAGVLVRYETFVRPQDRQWDQWINNQKEKFRRATALLETEVANFGDTIDIGTLSVAIALDYMDFRYSDENWRAQCPALSAWHKSMSARPSLARTLPEDLK